MIFQLGKEYIHTSGLKIRIVGELKKELYGTDALVAEDISTGELAPVGIGEEYTVNFKEVQGENKYCHPIEKNLNKRCRQTGYFCSECNKIIGYSLQIQHECGCLIDWNEIDDQSIKV